MDNNFPTFTPPAPTFTPPTNSYGGGGRTCHFHQNEPAVARCACCGKPICEDCAENYQVAVGEYEGEALCYECCRDVVAQNIKELKKQRTKIIFQYIFTIIGMLFGAFVIGSGAGPLGMVIWALVGGCLWTFIVNMFKILVNTIKNCFAGAWLGAIIWFFIDTIKALIISIWGTIQKIFYYTKHLIKTAGFIKSDTQALQQMADYMEYTIIRSQNAGVDLETLMAQDASFSNNTFAQNVLQNGEAQAENALRNCVTTINENGEIIRSFVA